jgi:putative ABC transport system permease protein
MLKYYFMLGLRNLRRNPALTALIALTLAIGVAASVSTLTVLHVMSGDPIPYKSDKLLVPLLDSAPDKGFTLGMPPRDKQMSYPDAKNLMDGGQGVRRTAVYGISGKIDPDKPNVNPVRLRGLAVAADYFKMFDVPFLYGSSWSAEEDKKGSDVIVLSRAQSETIFGKNNPVGRRLHIFDHEFQVVGVIDHWNPVPRYTHLVNSTSKFSGEEEMFIPFASAIRNEVQPDGSISCHWPNVAPGFKGFIASECTWIQFWFEAGAASDRAALDSYLNAYMGEQHKLGRFPRKVPAKLFNVMEWMDYMGVVRDDSKLAAWLAFGFLLLCLVNTVGLLLAKFSARASEVGVRRALGASRWEVFKQFLIESGVIGLAGGLLGLLLSFGGLWLISLQSEEMAAIAHLDGTMLAVTFGLAVGASLLAGLLPTWRACQVTPALQLKSQ